MSILHFKTIKVCTMTLNVFIIVSVRSVLKQSIL